MPSPPFSSPSSFLPLTSALDGAIHVHTPTVTAVTAGRCGLWSRWRSVGRSPIVVHEQRRSVSQAQEPLPVPPPPRSPPFTVRSGDPISFYSRRAPPLSNSECVPDPLAFPACLPACLLASFPTRATNESRKKQIDFAKIESRPTSAQLLQYLRFQQTADGGVWGGGGPSLSSYASPSKRNEERRFQYCFHLVRFTACCTYWVCS